MRKRVEMQEGEPAFSGKFEPTKHEPPPPEEPKSRGLPPPRAARAEFAEPARPATEKDVRADLARVVEKVWVEDVEATYDRLEAALRAGEKRSEHAFLREALDESAQNYFLAHRLHVTARLERDRWELENASVFGEMRSKALESLNSEKDDRKSRGEAVGKAISEADVEMRASVLFPSEWKAQRERRQRLEHTVKLLEQLAVAWSFRCGALRDMIKV